MSHHRTIPIHYDSPRWYGPDLYDPLFRDYNSSSLVHRDPFRDIVREHIRDPSVYHSPPVGVAGPLTRSFFNPERQLAQMDHEMQRMASEMRRMFTDVQHLVPVDSNPESWRIKENFHLDNPVHQDHRSGNRIFRLQFDVRQFKPEEIYVKTVGNQLEVHAKHGENGEGKSLHREYHRMYTLPKDMNPESLVSKLTRDGVLSIEAPLPISDHKEKLIPIKHE
ncbi:heat shock protein beta-1 [Plakobranchus ocellatus]|uniref:Heat shock protein beta-1 n=1 Tax=Plakobranchus ocellatus TaxID=259542 RepID=A0AAV4BM89_9GAST|nr:heat shock protein beta-1 [Plakobranchus ocellatus]